MDEPVIFGLEKCKASLEGVALMWVLKKENKTRKEMAFPCRHPASHFALRLTDSTES